MPCYPNDSRTPSQKEHPLFSKDKSFKKTKEKKFKFTLKQFFKKNEQNKQQVIKLQKIKENYARPDFVLTDRPVPLVYKKTLHLIDEQMSRITP